MSEFIMSGVLEIQVQRSSRPEDFKDPSVDAHNLRTAEPNFLEPFLFCVFYVQSR